MGFKRLVNASISADQFKKWFFSGYTNANGGRELEIFNSVAELVWRRRDRKYNVGSPTAPNPEHITQMIKNHGLLGSWNYLLRPMTKTTRPCGVWVFIRD